MKMKTEDVNKKLAAGIECPVCGKVLEELEPQGIFIGASDIHSFECEKCGIAMIISTGYCDYLVDHEE